MICEGGKTNSIHKKSLQESLLDIGYWILKEIPAQWPGMTRIEYIPGIDLPGVRLARSPEKDSNK